MEETFTFEELAAEEWRDVVGYEGWYQVSNLGRIKRIDTGRILKPGSTPGGYSTSTLYKNGIPHTYSLHKIVAAAFIGPRPHNHEINHKRPKTGKRNNRANNLEYLTKSEHEKHTVLHKLRARGKHNGTHTHPEKLLRGDDHWTHKHPELVARGINSPMAKHPDLFIGEKNPAAKLRKTDIDEIKQLLTNGLTQWQIARLKGVSQSAISRIKRGVAWRKVH